MGPLALAAAVPSLIKIGGTLFGGNNKKKLREHMRNRPQYETPEQVKEALAIAEMQAAGERPGATQDAENIQLAQANSINAVQRRGGSISALAGIQANTNKAMREQSVINAQYADQKQKDLQSALMTRAQYEDMEFQMNEFAPFSDRYNQLRERIAANRQAVHSGITELAGLGVTAAQNGSFDFLSSKKLG